MNNKKEADALKEELKKLLDSKLDYADINRINNIIERLNELEPEERIMEKKEAWENFKENYLSQNYTESSKTKLFKKRNFSVAFAILLIFMCTGIVSAAAGINLFEPVIEWTKDILNLDSDNDYIISEDKTKYFTSVSALEKYLGESITVPKYLPQETQIDTIGLFDDNSITITYLTGNKNIKYNIITKTDNYDISVEKTDAEAEKYTVNDTDFYIFKNTKWSVIYWYDVKYIYYIKTTISKDELIKIINSIK